MTNIHPTMLAHNPGGDSGLLVPLLILFVIFTVAAVFTIIRKRYLLALISILAILADVVFLLRAII